jgi:hypothetical protein
MSNFFILCNVLFLTAKKFELAHHAMHLQLDIRSNALEIRVVQSQNCIVWCAIACIIINHKLLLAGETIPLQLSTQNLSPRNPHLTKMTFSYEILRSSIAPRSVRFGLRLQKLSNVDQSLDGWPKIFYLELKPLVLAAFAFVSTHLPALDPRGGWPVLLMCNP